MRNTNKIFDDRRDVSQLIFHVLTEKLTVRQALLEFPQDTRDSSVKAAYHALVHFEADEDLRRRDLLYKDEQDDYLEFIANVLSNGSELPKNIIKSYDKYYRDVNVPQIKGLNGLMKYLSKILNV